ncbi:Glycosyltransferase involved in cell wall bisynthesis [Eubacterium callanderi]|uniref:Glycosyltransferase involved in cell wall bisynthesis n=2 Tax=Eubacterium callanderi TaxID=53442 RepID=A0AB74F129_9FIRM|nr:glycosyltransferase [Eubacterium callanderi]OEZ02685.1 putative glycosyl transferase [[Butyribacterium] methylotrophicum]GFZ22393.1 hypothetical protein CMETHOX_03160 [[Clostridium] methoxybenzovorans]ADO36958.1 hypothetical protein ELI_1975 [Eubacterium callanderi]MCB6658181.1 glycosyltransferase [Eubacterium callanderi]MCB6750536.1 glycosyltransferase [Eubacterium callanderi]
MQSSKKDQILFSVIILTYNNTEYLFGLLDSLFKQTYNNIELIISDDASTSFDMNKIDNYIKSNKKNNIVSYQIIIRKKNGGTVKNINGALKRCNGEIIKLIAADDAFYNDNVIENFVEYYKENSALIYITRIEICDIALNIINKNNAFSYDEIKKLLIVNKYERFDYACRFEVQPPFPGLFFTKKFFDLNGYLDEEYILSDGAALWYKLIRENYDIDYCDIVSVRYRTGSGISTQKKKNPRMEKDLKLLYEKEILKYKKMLSKKTLKKCMFTYCRRYQFENYTFVNKIEFIIKNFNFYFVLIFKILKNKLLTL